MIDEKALDMFAEDLVVRLLKVVDEQKKTIANYEGAIEGIKLFMQELKKKLEEESAKSDSASTKVAEKVEANEPTHN